MQNTCSDCVFCWSMTLSPKTLCTTYFRFGLCFTYHVDGLMHIGLSGLSFIPRTRAAEKSAFDSYHARVQSRLYRLDFSVSLFSLHSSVTGQGYAGFVYPALILCFLYINFRFSAIDRFLVIPIFLFSRNLSLSYGDSTHVPRRHESIS